jgi:pyrrolidone-carboxylate peptidase
VVQDANASKSSMSSSVQRAVTKSSSYYQNAGWDLVDAVQNNQVKLADVKEADLPANMRKMDAKERAAYVTGQLGERQKIQKEIAALNLERQKYVDAETRKLAEAKGEKTLDAAMSESLRAQAAKKAFEFGSAK